MAATKYKPEFAKQAEKLCALGATDYEVADFFGINRITLYRWKTANPALTAAMTAGKEPADARVVRSLFMRAVGYEHDDMDIRTVEGVIVQTPIRKYYPPDTGAICFWLKNRLRNEWRDKVETGVTDKDGNDVAQPEPMDVARRVAFILAQGAVQKASAASKETT